MGAQVVRGTPGPRRRSTDAGIVSPTLRTIWLELLIGQLVIYSIYGGCAFAAVHFGPQMLKHDTGQSILRLAELPPSWPLPEVKLSDGAIRAELLPEYKQLGEFTVDGKRWTDTLNYGKYPILWMVRFRDDDPYPQVIDQICRQLQMPLYKLEEIQRTTTATRYVFQYCDGDTLVYVDGPGPDSREHFYTVQILMYDH
jgi:hypothetical protein